MARRPKTMAEVRRSVRCAIYTRKSTDEGLEQEFNSLDAQWEACAAYIASQRHEGWSMVRDRYDDGGFSGGNMQRPGLVRLLADIEAGKVDVIVVYKVDRLTRALSDFAKIVEILDARGASFVSITQSFNTTTSMGRLTLNVLLSFAQFEREVTGERIRDKIAASKKKGMWMGGPVPLGYAVKDRKLVMVEQEASVVRHIMQRYLALGSGGLLVDQLKAQGYRTRQTMRDGNVVRGGVPFTRGMLFHLMSNRVYIGEIVHQCVAYPGEHEAIVPRELWDAVQEQVERNRVARTRRENMAEQSLLTGIISDGEGRRMSPSHAVKGARRYRYYITHAADREEGDQPVRRLAAHDVENVVISRLRQLLESRSMLLSLAGDQASDATAASALLSAATYLVRKLDDPQQRRYLVRAIVSEVVVAQDQIALHVSRAQLLEQLGASSDAETTTPDQPLTLVVPYQKERRGKEVRLIVNSDQAEAPHADGLLKLIAEAQATCDAVLAAPEKSIRDIAQETNRCRTRVAQLVRIATLAPDIIQRCIAGTQPPTLTARKLLSIEMPIAWDEQRAMLDIS